MAEQYQTVRWLLTGGGLSYPQAYHHEGTARQQAERLEAARNTPITVTKQRLVDGEWANDDGSEAPAIPDPPAVAGPPPWGELEPGETPSLKGFWSGTLKKPAWGQAAEA